MTQGHGTLVPSHSNGQCHRDIPSWEHGSLKDIPTHGAITHHCRTLGMFLPQRHVATAPIIPSHAPEGIPSWEQSSPEDTCSYGIPASLSHSYEAVVAGGSFMFLSPCSRHSGDQGDPSGEEFPGFRALPRGRSQAGLHHVLHHPLRDGLQAADAQRGWCMAFPIPCVHPWGPSPFPTSHHPHPNLTALLFLRQLSARRTSTYG